MFRANAVKKLKPLQPFIWVGMNTGEVAGATGTHDCTDIFINIYNGYEISDTCLKYMPSVVTTKWDET